MKIDAQGMYYRQLNEHIREAVKNGEKNIEVLNVNGQRYIGDGIIERVNIFIDGVPGNDLGAFMNGPTIQVNSNAQDCIGNTMNSGKIVIHGNAGDVLGYAMRGGKLFVKNDIGYRAGIHMKAYEEHVPIIIAGGRAGDFFGEYMAGGILVLLGLQNSDSDFIAGKYLGTGMHGGVIYLRGRIEKEMLGAEVGVKELDPDDIEILDTLLHEFCDDFGYDFAEVKSKPFVKLLPITHRPYGRLYAY